MTFRIQPRNVIMSPQDCNTLLALNRQLKELTHHLKAVAHEVIPQLEAKLAAPYDPMYGYEIDAHIAYQLREDDPAYDDQDDNYLSVRHEPLKRRLWMEIEINAGDDRPNTPALLNREPHCWLFHDLYDHSYGPEAPCLPYDECLRIGRIVVDVQVRQHYIFDVPSK
jgi:hypothetical protein